MLYSENYFISLEVGKNRKREHSKAIKELTHKYIPELDILRTLFIVYIVVFHVYGFLIADYFFNDLSINVKQIHSFKDILKFIIFTIFSHGYLGVPAFLTLSGFGLYIGYRNIRPNLDFYKRRLSTLLIPFYNSIPIVLIAIAVYYTFTFRYFPARIILPHHIVISIGQLSLHTILITILFPFIPDFSSFYITRLNGSWWFLPLIIEFYIIYPFIIKAINRYGMNVVFALSIIINILYPVFCVNVLKLYMPTLPNPENIALAMFPSYLASFVFGIFLADKLYKSQRIHFITNFGFILSLLGLFVTVKFEKVLIFQQVEVLEGSLLFVAMFYIASYIKQTKFLVSLFRTLSKKSYTVYLTHQPYIFLWVAILLIGGNRVLSKNSYNLTIELSIPILVLSFLLAFITDYFKIGSRALAVLSLILQKGDQLLIKVKYWEDRQTLDKSKTSKKEKHKIAVLFFSKT